MNTFRTGDKYFSGRMYFDENMESFFFRKLRLKSCYTAIETFLLLKIILYFSLPNHSTKKRWDDFYEELLTRFPFISECTLNDITYYFVTANLLIILCIVFMYYRQILVIYDHKADISR